MIIFRAFKSQHGFSLIELLVVIAILATLTTLVITSINPARQLSQTNNAKRQSDVLNILNAVHHYMSENQGNVPVGVDATTKTISNGIGSGSIDLCSVLVTRYISDIPIDPRTGVKSYTTGRCTQSGATYNSHYTITRALDNRVTVSAPDADLGETIRVSR